MIVGWGTSETVGQWDSETVKTAVICRLSIVGCQLAAGPLTTPPSLYTLDNKMISEQRRFC